MDAEQRLQIINLYKELVLREVSPPTTCESCGAEIPTRSSAINTNNISYVFNGQIGSPGHPALSVLQCPIADGSEHWACSPECWEKVAIDCIKNHQRPILDHFHARFHPSNAGKMKTNGNTG